MVPLIFANSGDSLIIKKVGGNREMKKHLENLGFVVGGEISVISENDGDLIVSVKESHVAVSREMAEKIMV